MNTDAIEPRAWWLLAIFVGTLVGIVTRPLPMGAVAMVGLAAAVATRTLTITEALSGFSNTTAWLVLAAFFLAAGFTKTGLGTRIGYRLVILSGRSTLGLGYSLTLTDLALAPAIASNTARAGGVVFPILQSIARNILERDAVNGPKASAFLTLNAYQTTVITSGMFITAMVANPLIVQFAANQGITITWAQWATAAIVPGAVSLAVVPLVIFRMCRPPWTLGDGARELATHALRQMGPMKSSERTTGVTAVFLLVAWIVGPTLSIDATAAALSAIAVLLVTRILSWDDLLREKEAWNTYIWFSVLVMMAGFLGQFGLVDWFSRGAASTFATKGWVTGFVGLSLVYFYTHYFFASNTAHAGTMYAPFLGVAMALGTPPKLAALLLAYFSSLCACTTHYGTPPGPVLFGSGFVPLSLWWKTGAVVSIVHIFIWLTIGVAWWRMLGLW